MPLVRRTRATLRRAELGFFGVCVKTRTQTPRFCGLTCNAGLFVLVTIFLRPCRTSWLIVGIARTGDSSPCCSKKIHARGCESQPRRRFRPEDGRVTLRDRLAPETIDPIYKVNARRQPALRRRAVEITELTCAVEAR